MPEDKNLTDGDRIKELLAQLRATMELEESSSAPASSEVPEGDGYTATLDELLAGEEGEEAVAALPDESDGETEADGNGLENGQEEPEEEPEEEVLETSGEQRIDEDQIEKGDAISEMLSSFFAVDPSDRHGQVSVSDAFLDTQDIGAEEGETETFAEEDSAYEGEDENEETIPLFCSDEGASLSFDEKVDIVPPTAIPVPSDEEEEEDRDFVSEGGFGLSEDKETAEEEPFSVLPVGIGGTLSFGGRVSLSSWGEMPTDEDDEGDGEEKANLSEQAVVAEEAEITVEASAETEALPSDACFADEMPLLTETAVADGLTEEKDSASLGEDACCEDESSPPDLIEESDSLGLSDEPLPYVTVEEDEGKSMVFERVEDDKDGEEAVAPPTPVLDVIAPEDEPSAEEDASVASGGETGTDETQKTVEQSSEAGHHSPRIQLAPPAYRASKEKDTKIDKAAETAEDDEDFMSGIPGVMRHFLEDFPFGRTNRVQSASGEATKKKAAEAQSRKTKKKKDKHFFVEEEREYCDPADSVLVKERLQGDLRAMRARFVVVSVFALLLLVIENVPFFSAHALLDAGKVGYAEAFLLFGMALAAYPCLHMGACGVRYRCFLPETILLAQWVLSFLYALTFAILEMEVPHFSFVCALGLCISLFFHMIWRENRVICFEQLTAPGDKLIFSPVSKKEMKAERQAMGVAQGDTLNLYRVRKTPFVDEFSYRTSIVCEDGISNLISLILLLSASACAFVITFVTTKDMIKSVGALALALSLVPPLTMCAVHVYPMNRALRVAGNDSTILGEETVNEAVSLDAIAFEDIEAVTQKDVSVTFVRMYENPIFVLSCLNAVFRTIGGPLANYFASADQTKDATKRTVKLEEAVSGGFTATVDGMLFCVGGGEYMERKKTLPPFDAKDAKAESEKQAVLYVAMNGSVCAKFYIRYRLSAVFEKNVRRLSRLGIATLVRTYDPCLSDDFVAKISSLGNPKIRVIHKTPEQRADFAASHAPGGIVTAGHSGKLLQLLFLCFGVHRTTRVGRVYKLALAGVGAAAAVVIASLGGLGFLPSALVALYQILGLSFNVMYVRCRIRIPKATEGKHNETSRGLRSPESGR